MKVAIVNYNYNKDANSPDALLDQLITLTGWAEGLRRAGADVTVFLRFNTNIVIERKGIKYNFIFDHFGQTLKWFEMPFRLHWTIAKKRPDIVHINGFQFPFQSLILRKTLPFSTAVILQNHGEKPKRLPKRLFQYLMLHGMDGYIFTAKENSKPWIKSKIIESMDKVFTVMEGSTLFSRRDRETCRKITGFKGSPIFLWVGRLDGNKDPLTVLKGFDLALEKLPNARLYMIFKKTGLISLVEEIIKKRKRLHNAVELIGAVAHSEMEYYYNSSDYYLLGTHYEGSGYALVESLACGVVPIISDIPSSRLMTGDGEIGRLWRVGDHIDCAEKIIDAATKPLNKQADAAYRYYLEHLSFNAIGRGALEIYERILIGR
ncbi:MAG: glycosyltransferase family 4 protein [Nitrospirae bacterium]|nr:glycosyltransferase family 4 protein [Nitrospirota bacterium]